jgi:DNA polymerase I
MLDDLPFPEIWACDFEYGGGAGNRSTPVCLVARELRSGRELRLWQDELETRPAAPFPVGDDALFVAYYASAEIGCFLALGWPVPTRILDLFTEFRAGTNGLPTASGANLLGALIYFGLDAMGATEKEDMRNLVLRGGPWSDTEHAAILDYCATDVDALARLLPAMLPGILARPHGLGHALLRGRYMAAAAAMEHAGVPIDTGMLDRLRNGWAAIQEHLICDVDRDFSVYDGRSFRSDRFAEYLRRNDLPWPRLPSGSLALDDDTFREMSNAFPQVRPLRELRHALGQMRLADLAVGEDGYNRTLLSAFRARTGRNQPSNSKFIFGPARWLRSLVKPPPGHGLAYIDYTSQEIGIAAALSGDANMIAAYQSGDVYLAFAKQAGLAPPDATKATHKDVRDRCKAVVLGVNYGMGAEGLAQRIGVPPVVARDLLARHRRTYPTFWRWSEAAVDTAMLHGVITTVFGWPLHVGANANPRSLMNFPVQANAAEMLRLACCLATERGIRVCAPVHDALLIEAPLDRLDAAVAATRIAMAEASRIVLAGFEVATDVTVVRWPDRYLDERGAAFWHRVVAHLDRIDEAE